MFANVCVRECVLGIKDFASMVGVQRLHTQTHTYTHKGHANEPHACTHLIENRRHDNIRLLPVTSVKTLFTRTIHTKRCSTQSSNEKKTNGIISFTVSSSGLVQHIFASVLRKILGRYFLLFAQITTSRLYLVHT